MDKLDIKYKGLLVKGKINISKDAIERKFISLMGGISKRDLHLMKVSITAYISAIGVMTILSMPNLKIDTNLLDPFAISSNKLLDDLQVDSKVEKEIIRKAVMQKLSLEIAAKNAFSNLNSGKDSSELDTSNDVVTADTTTTSLNSTTTTASTSKQEENDKYKVFLAESNYLIEENLDRYVAYYKENPDLSVLDVIARVNVNLDYETFDNIVDVPVPNSPLALVNKFYRLPNEYVPKGYPDANQNGSKDVKTQYLVGEAGELLNSMVDAAKKAGLKITKESGYRSYNYQYTVYWKKSAGEKNLTDEQKKIYQEDRDKVSARAGLSEHQSGLSMDVNNGEGWCLLEQSFEKTDEFAWLKAHAHEYGFILRYPKGKENITGYSYEPWHYRYVGKKIAKVIYENNLTFEEFYGLYIAPIASKDKSALNLSGDEFYKKYLNKYFEYQETNSIIAAANDALKQANKDIHLYMDESEEQEIDVETLVLTK